MNTKFRIPAGLALVTFISAFTAMLTLGVISPLGVQGADQSIDDNGQAVDFQPAMVMDFTVDNTVKRPGDVSGFRFTFTTSVDLVANQDAITIHFDKEFRGHGTNLSKNHVTVSASHATDATTGDSANIIQTGAYNPSTDATLDRLAAAHPVHHGEAHPTALTNSNVLNNIEYLIPVPDMNGVEDGAPGIAAGSTVTLAISPAAGITNATEAGNRGPLGVYTSQQQQLVYGTVPVVLGIALNDYDANRGKALKVIGRGFREGTTATVYLDNANSTRQELVSEPVATDNTFQAVFTVTVPPFVPGKGNWLYAEDGNQPPQVSNRVEFEVEGLLTVSPTSAAVGDEVDITLEDWPNGPIPADTVTIAGVTQKIIGSPNVSGNSANFQIEIWTGTPSGTDEIWVTANGESDVQMITITDTFSPDLGVTGDRAALVDLYNATDGANWTNNTNWLTDAPLGQWYGVETDVNGRVILLYLVSNRLTGQIPLELGNLTRLAVLYLGGNQLTGCVPAGLWNVAYNVAYHDIAELGLPLCASVRDRTALVTIYNATDGANWANNTGWLTDAPLYQWYGVTVDPDGRVGTLYLRSNGLTGTIPPELGSLAGLGYLDLSGNQLSREIPAELGNLTNLQELNLWGNQFTGKIPAELGGLTNLQELDLGANQLDGTIPGELGSMANLQGLSLWGNQFTGKIPAELGGLTNLQSLYLNENRLIGGIPPELGNLTNLRELNLRGNQFTGKIPPELGSLTNLEWLILSANQLSGAIPGELGGLTGLQWLYLDNNQLGGVIPGELGNLTNLTELYLLDNKLTGQMPSQLGNLSNLTQLRLSGNQLSGEIPAEMGSLTNLEWLNLSGNRLSGEIPGELGGLTDLRRLELGGNRLSGEIPAELGNLTNLQELNLWGNQFTGEIPAELAGLHVAELDLSRNQLSGEIPAELGSLAYLKGLRLHDNQLSGEIPAELGGLHVAELDLSRNQLSGEIPAQLGSLVILGDLDLSGNQLSGEIPAELGGLTYLYWLSFSNNQLGGEIPKELGNLTNLYALELNDNQLSGRIPDELGNLTNLEILRLSSNRLTGCVLESLHSVASHDLVELGLPFCDMLDGRPVVVVRFVSEAGAPVRLGSPVSLEATFSEPVSGFGLEDVSVVNGIAGNFAGSGAAYTFDVTPNAIGEVAVDIAEGVAQDADGNSNVAARLSLGIPYDDDGDGMISRSEAIAAISDYFDETITREQVIAVITLYLSG